MSERPKIKFNNLPKVVASRNGMREKLYSRKQPGIEISRPEGDKTRQEIKSLEITLGILKKRVFEKQVLEMLPDSFKESQSIEQTTNVLPDYGSETDNVNTHKESEPEISPEKGYVVEPVSTVKPEELEVPNEPNNKATKPRVNKSNKNITLEDELAKVKPDYDSKVLSEGLKTERYKAPASEPVFDKGISDAFKKAELEKNTSRNTKEVIFDKGIEDAFKKGSEKRVNPAPEKSIEGDKTMLRMVLTSRGPEAMKKMEEQLNKGKNRNREQQTAALVFAEKMYSRENAYFSALKKFHKERKFGSLLIDNFTKREIPLPRDIQDLKHEWMLSRSEYAGHMKNSALRRLNDGPSDPRKRESTMDRYGRLVITKEILFGAEEAEKRAITEGLATREKKGLEKLFASYKKLSKPARVLISSVLVGTTAAVAMAGGSLIGTLGFAMAVPAAITAAIGLTRKNTESKKWWGNVAGAFSLFTLNGLLGSAGELGARGAHGLLGTRKKAEKDLTQRQGLGDLSDVNNLGRASNIRHEALRADEKISVDARRWRMGATLAGGIGAGLAAPHFEAPGMQEHLSIGDHADGVNINDGDKLLGHFAKQLQDHHPVGTPPPAVEKFYDLFKTHGHTDVLYKHGEDVASIKSGLIGPDGSVVLQPHDTISLDSHDHIVIDRPGHPEMHHVLVDENGVHKLPTEVWRHAQVRGHVDHGSHPESAPTKSSPEAEHKVDTSHDRDDIALNDKEHAEARTFGEQHTPVSAQPDLSKPIQTSTEQPIPKYVESPTPIISHAHPAPETAPQLVRVPEAPHSIPPVTSKPIEMPAAVASPAESVPHAAPQSVNMPEAPHAVPSSPTYSHDEELYNAAMKNAIKAPAGAQFPYDRHMESGIVHHNAIVADGKGGGTPVFDISSPT